MSYPIHYVPAGDVLPVFFSTYDGGTGASITMTGLAVTDIEIYKDGGVTQRASDAGYTLLDTDGIDFDTLTGIHGFSIDTGDNTDAGFYAVGAWYHVVVSAVTVDTQTVNFIAAAFRLMAAEGVAGKPKVDVDAWLGTAAATPTVAGVPEVDLTHVAGATTNVAALATNVDAILTDTADMQPKFGTPAGVSISADIAAIEAQTDDIGVAGAGLTAVPWNPAWDAEVQSEVDDAIVARNLDKLILVSGTADSGSTTTMVDAARTEADADYWKGRLILFTSGVIAGQCAFITDFNATTDTFTLAPALTQAVGTQTYIVLPGVSVWDDTLAEHLAAGSTGNALNAAGAAGDPWSTALPGAYGAGSAGKIIGDNMNATVSSRSSHSAADVWVAGTRTLTAATNITSTGGTTVPQTGDSFARLGAPAGLSVSADVAAVKVDTAAILVDTGTTLDARIPATLVGGRMDASVGAMASGVITAAAHAAGAIDATALATDAIGAAELSQAAANKIADSTLRRTYANARISTDGDAVNFRSLLGAVGKLVNKWAISGSTLTMYQEDDLTSTAPGGTQTVTGTAGADPITTLDTV